MRRTKSKITAKNVGNWCAIKGMEVEELQLEEKYKRVIHSLS